MSMTMNGPEMVQARADWNAASVDCDRITRHMQLLDVEEPVYGELAEELAEATARRVEAGDRIHKISSAALKAIGKTLKAMR